MLSIVKRLCFETSIVWVMIDILVVFVSSMFSGNDMYSSNSVLFASGSVNIYGACVCVYSIQGHFKFKSLKLRRNALKPLPTEDKSWNMSDVIPLQVTANSAPLQIQITEFYVSTSVPSHRKLEVHCLHISAPIVCQCKCPMLHRGQFAHRCGLRSTICTSDFSKEDRILV